MGLLFGGMTALYAFGQDVEWSGSSELDRDVEQIQILGKNNKGYLVLLDGKKDFWLQYSEGLQEGTKHPISLPSRQNSKRIASFLDFSGGLIFFSHRNASGHNTLTAQKYIFNTQVQQKEQTVFPGKAERRRSFFVAQSQGYQYYLGGASYQKKKKHTLQLQALNRNLESVWQTQLAMNGSSSSKQLLRYGIDNEQRGYLLFSGSHQQAAPYQLHVYDPSADSFFQFTVGPSGVNVEDVVVKADNINQCIVVAGIYADQNSQSLDGTFFSRVSLSEHQVVADTQQSFSSGFQSKMFSTQIESGKKKESDFLLRDIVLRSDGGAIITVESFLKTVVSYTSPNFYSTYTRYENTYFHYNDIVVSSISPKGREEWKQLIKKRQVAESPNNIYSSFEPVAVQDHLYFVFNDNLSNNSNVIQYQVAPSGTKERSSLFKGLVAARWGKQVAHNEVLFPSLDRRSFQIVRITY